MNAQVLQVAEKTEHAIGYIFVVLLALIAPVQTTMLSLGGLIILDCITGIWAALKQGQKFNSARYRDTLTKMLLYNLAVLSGYALEKYLLADAFPVSKIIAGMAGSVELASVLENINIITNSNVFDKVISKLGSKNKED